MPSIMCWDTSGGEEPEEDDDDEAEDDDDDEAEDDDPKSWNTLFLLKLTSKHLKIKVSFEVGHTFHSTPSTGSTSLQVES